jgi:hypothetical protein
MQSVTLVVGIAIMLAGFALGFRLLRLARATRKAPELAMGLYCTLVSVCAVLLTVAHRGLGPEHPLAAPLAAASTLSLGAAAFSLAVGIWRIFRPGERWARALVGCFAVGLAAGWLATVASGKTVSLADATAANAAYTLGRVAIYFWGAFEALRYHAMLRRRVALGLADPVSAHQILLWGVAWLSMSAIAFVSLHAAFVRVLSPTDPAAPFYLLAGNALNLAAWTCTWCAFFPPRAYQRWIESRARGAA